MTEIEIKSLIEWFKVRKGKTLKLNDKGIDCVVKALEEVQEYRTIGLTPELIEAMQGHNIALINDLGEYQSIGTVEEFKDLKEKSADIEKIIESIKQLPTQDFMGVLHIPRTATINRIKRGGNCELPEV